MDKIKRHYISGIAEVGGAKNMIIKGVELIILRITVTREVTCFKTDNGCTALFLKSILCFSKSGKGIDGTTTWLIFIAAELINKIIIQA
jgi:hypothetical protein